MTDYERGEKLLCGAYSSYTPTGAGYFKKAGRWFTEPKAGDVVYFYNASLGRIGHVGFVTFVNPTDKTFRTLEGNTSSTQFTTNGGCVASHSYSYMNVGGKNRVQGFGRPMYGSDTITAAQLLDYVSSWTGYEEKKSNGTVKQLEDKHWNAGENNYTIFGHWYGMNPAQWCQMFVSYCAYMACRYNPIGRKVSDWIHTEDGWFYSDENGNIVHDTWRYIGGRWYVFDGSGKMITGWFKDSSGDWYFLANDGGMCASQWIESNGKQYYVSASGAMATDAYIKAEMRQNGKDMFYYVDEKGEWKPEVFTSSIPYNKEVVR